MQTIVKKITIPGQYNNFGYTYKPYEFSYKVSPQYDQNEKLDMLIQDEIRKISWSKLQEWKKSTNSFLMPNEYVQDVGQLATDTILQKCKTLDDINKLYDYQEQQKKILFANSCEFCGQQLEKCSPNCDRRTFSKTN